MFAGTTRLSHWQAKITYQRRKAFINKLTSPAAQGDLNVSGEVKVRRSPKELREVKLITTMSKSLQW